MTEPEFAQKAREIEIENNGRIKYYREQKMEDLRYQKSLATAGLKKEYLSPKEEQEFRVKFQKQEFENRKEIVKLTASLRKAAVGTSGIASDGIKMPTANSMLTSAFKTIDFWYDGYEISDEAIQNASMVILTYLDRFGKAAQKSDPDIYEKAREMSHRIRETNFIPSSAFDVGRSK